MIRSRQPYGAPTAAAEWCSSTPLPLGVRVWRRRPLVDKNLVLELGCFADAEASDDMPLGGVAVRVSVRPSATRTPAEQEAAERRIGTHDSGGGG